MVSTTAEVANAGKGALVKQRKLHPFMPAVMHKPRIIRWLKRFHAWFGVWGAVAGIIFAWSGFVLNHRTDFRIGAENVVTELTIPAPESRSFASGDDFGHYVKEQMDLNGRPQAPGMGGSGAVAVPGGPRIESPTRFQANFPAAASQVAASYETGNESIEVTHTERPTLRRLNRLHVGVAPNMGWQLLMDAFSGALIFLCLSGMLIWSRLDGSRLVGASLISTSFLLVSYWIFIGP